MTAFLQKYTTPLLVLLAVPALLIVLGMTGAWAPAVTFTRKVGLLPAAEGPTLSLGTAPDWSLKDLDGRTVSSADFKGKVVLVNFWATWCPPCVAEIPDFIKVQEEFRSRGLTILGISMDEGGTDLVKAFIKEHGMNYPVLQGDPAVARAFGGIDGIPASFLIDQKGKIILHRVGQLGPEAFKKALTPLLPP